MEKSLLPILLFFLALLIFGCVTSPVEQECSGKEGNELAICIIEFAVNNEDETICERLESQSKAVLGRDAISGSVLSREACYTKIAEKKQDVSLCEKGTQECYSAFAETEGNPEHCDKLLGTTSRMFCTGEKVIDRQGCEWITADAKEACYLSIALSKNAPELCGDEKAISNTGLRDKCYSEIAFENEDKTLCAEVSGGHRQDCYRAVETLLMHTESKKTYELAIETGNEKLCEEVIESPLGPKDYSGGYSEGFCYYRIAVQTRDHSLCEKAYLGEDDNETQSCHDQIYYDTARETPDPELCDKILGPYRNSCFSYIAAELFDRELCDKIEILYREARIQCTSYVDYRIELNKFKYCESDQDCKSIDGCEAGCWNSDAPEEVRVGCPTKKGPVKCKCTNNACLEAE
ncbi:MAG: hypothetical protein ABH854_01745 [Candidatus Diapherotrites archaeon]|nr:hypothetical protein [Candidatus Micrarchaeota archaeon]